MSVIQVTIKMDIVTPLFVAIILLCSENTESLKLLRLQVPDYVPLGCKAFLSCLWELGPMESLYSVKWYKDGKEFFRYVPRDIEPYKKFVFSGVNVQTLDSMGSNIILSAVTLDSEGKYRCEVSGERPLFPTVSRYANLVVVVIPNRSPALTNLRPMYTVGDRIQVNCTSGRSRPTTALSWYIDNVPAPAEYILPPKYIDHGNCIRTTSLTLNFKINKEIHLNSKLSIKCLATIPSVYWESSEVTPVIAWPIILNKTSKTSSYITRNILYNNSKSAVSCIIPLRNLNFSNLIIVIYFIFNSY